MKKQSSDTTQGQLRKLSFEALTEYPDGILPASLNASDLYPEIFKSARAKTSDRKAAEDALLKVREAARHKSGLDGVIASFIPPELSNNRLAQSLARLGLFDLLENGADPQTVFRELDQLYKNYMDRHSHGSEREEAQKESVERLLFGVLFFQLQYFVWNSLQEAGDSASFTPQLYKKICLKMGYDEEVPPPQSGVQVAEGILLHRDILDARLEKFYRHKRWVSLPPAYRNILRMGLYEILTGLATPQAIIDSLAHLTNFISLQGEYGNEEKGQTEKFIQTGLLKSARSIGRALAFQIIYSLAFNDIDSLAALRKAYSESPYNISGKADVFSGGEGVYSWRLVRGVWENLKQMDDIINKYSHKWRIERMGKIELTLLRLALFEMIYGHMPARIVMSEIMDIADLFGAEDAKNLVNGILDAVSKSDEYRLIEKNTVSE